MLHSKQWYYSLHRDFQNCYSTRRSLTRFFKLQFQLQFYMCTLHYITLQSTSREFSIQKSNSTCRRQRALHVLLLLHYRGQRDLHSRFQKRNSMHRRQGDLLEIHPCVLQDIPGIPATRPSKGTPVTTDIPVFPVFPDIPVVPHTPETFQTFKSFMTFQPFQAILQVLVSPGNPTHYSIL